MATPRLIEEEKGLQEDDFESFEQLLTLATRGQLDRILQMVEKEIRLSDTAIREGFEKTETM